MCRSLNDLLQGRIPWKVSGYCNTSSTCSTVKVTRQATPITPHEIYNTASARQTTPYRTYDTSFPCDATAVPLTALLGETCNNSIASRLPARSKSTMHRLVASQLQLQLHKTIKPYSHSRLFSSDKENRETMPSKWPQEYTKQHCLNPAKTTKMCDWRGQGNARSITGHRRSQRIEKSRHQW